MKKLFVLVPFMVVASMSHSAASDDGKEKARVSIIVNKEGISRNAEGNFILKGGPDDPEIFGEYTILIDETATVEDLVNNLYNQPNLFKDNKTGDLVRGLAISQLSRGLGLPNLMLKNPSTVLSTLGIKNGKEFGLEASIGPIGDSPNFYKDPACIYYARFLPWGKNI